MEPDDRTVQHLNALSECVGESVPIKVCVCVGVCLCVCTQDIHRLEADDSVLIRKGLGCVFAALEVVVEEPVGNDAQWDFK